MSERPWPTKKVNGALGSPMTDNATMMVDANDTPAEGTEWEVVNCTGAGYLSDNVMIGFLPVSGFFVVERNTPKETLAEGSAIAGVPPIGVNLGKRGRPIPMECSSPANAPGFGFSCAMAMRSSLPVVVLPGETIRMVVCCNPGQAAPGPGVGSYCTFSAIVRVRRTT